MLVKLKKSMLLFKNIIFKYKMKSFVDWNKKVKYKKCKIYPQKCFLIIRKIFEIIARKILFLIKINIIL